MKQSIYFTSAPYHMPGEFDEPHAYMPYVFTTNTLLDASLSALRLKAETLDNQALKESALAYAYTIENNYYEFNLEGETEVFIQALNEATKLISNLHKLTDQEIKRFTECTKLASKPAEVRISTQRSIETFTAFLGIICLGIFIGAACPVSIVPIALITASLYGYRKITYHYGNEKCIIMRTGDTLVEHIKKERLTQRINELTSDKNESTLNNYTDHLKAQLVQHEFLLASPTYQAAIESCHTFLDHPNSLKNRDDFLTINAELQNEINIAICTRKDAQMIGPAVVSMVAITTSLVALPHLATLSMVAATACLVGLPYIATLAIVGSLIYLAYNSSQANDISKQTDLTEKAIDLVNATTPLQQTKSTQGFFVSSLENDDSLQDGIPLKTLPHHTTYAN